MNDELRKAAEASRSPRVDALIERMMQKYPGFSASAQARYYEAVHQELAPLARDLEAENARLQSRLAAANSLLREASNYLDRDWDDSCDVDDRIAVHLQGAGDEAPSTPEKAE
jgi:hypothetical protein